MNAMMLPERNYKSLLLAALLIGAVGTAYAWENCGTNLEYEIDGTILRFNSPDPTQPAVIMTAAFKDNTTITSFTLPENVWQIGSQAFMGCTNLATVELSNVRDISTKAFEGCTSLDDVVIPPTVTNIGEHAFYGCLALHDVLCRPYNAPSLGTDAFTGCDAGLQICVPALSTYRYEDNWSNYYDNYVLTACEFLDESDEQSNTEAKINAYRFSSLTSVTLFRTLRKAGCFNTLTLPFSVPDLAASPLGGDNVEVYTFADATVENDELIFDIEKVTSNSLEPGVPYLIQWNNTGEVMTRMTFTGIDRWDDDNTAETTSGDVKYHGFYGKTHISDATNGDEEHFNLFLQGGNQLYWPTDGDNADAKMLGFRAWFQITAGSGAKNNIRRGMPASLRIVSATTGIESVEENSSLQGGDRGRLVLRDGQLIIIRNGEKYSITGQKL